MNRRRKVLIVLVVILITLQFVRPELNSSSYENINSFLKESNASKSVASSLKQACFDCHSDQTTYPWYANIAPVNLYITNHVRGGKKHFDVSEWQSYSLKKKLHKLEEIMEEVDSKEMPLSSYKLLHASADLSLQQRKEINKWAIAFKEKLQVN